MNKNKILIILISTLLVSCGGEQIGNTEEAIEYLESHEFYDEDASISGKRGGEINSSFNISFEDGSVLLNKERLSYTISEIGDGGVMFKGRGYKIIFCGSSRYAYGGCIDAYLTSGENGGYPTLMVKGDYVKAYMSSKFDDQIKEK